MRNEQESLIHGTDEDGGMEMVGYWLPAVVLCIVWFGIGFAVGSLT